jgi:hypothetical protein
MTTAVTPPSSATRQAARQATRSQKSSTARPRRDSGCGEPGLLGRYLDSDGRQRHVVALPGAGGSVLVVDGDACTLGERRLVAHLAADEPPENAALVCEHYLRDTEGHWCRRVTAEDRQVVPFGEVNEQDPDPAAEATPSSTGLTDRQGRTYGLELCPTAMSILELRWHRRSPTAERSEQVVMREVIASLESYEPVRTLTSKALALHRADPEVSTVMLRTERARVEKSEIVLNRGLRRAALAAAATQDLSMSEIAMRCGKIRCDARGRASGETSWLARRLGLAPEGGGGRPTPWIHTDVLALIARRGLGISPREVELG